MLPVNDRRPIMSKIWAPVHAGADLRSMLFVCCERQLYLWISKWVCIIAIESHFSLAFEHNGDKGLEDMQKHVHDRKPRYPESTRQNTQAAAMIGSVSST